MITKRVLVVGTNSLIGAGIESALSQEKDLDVRGVAPTSEPELIAQIWLHRPQVVVVIASLPFANPACLLNQLESYPRLKFIVINETNNLVQIYEKQAVLAGEHIELGAIVRSNALELAYKMAAHWEPVPG